MIMDEVLKQLKSIEKEQQKIESKYFLDSKGMRPKWTKKDTARFATLRKQQKQLVGVACDDVLTVHKLVKLIVKIVKVLKQSFRVTRGSLP